MWKLRDIVLCAVLSVACGALYLLWDYLANFIPSFAPWILGIINGAWWIASILVAYIVRKPGAALLAGVVSSFCEFAFGSPYGLSAVLAGLLQGGFVEIGLALFAWKRYGSFVVMFAGLLGGVGNFIQWYFQYQGNDFSFGNQLGYLVMTLISGALLAGLLPLGIARALFRTGSLRNYEIGKQLRASAE